MRSVTSPPTRRTPNTDSLNQSLDTLSETLDQIAPQLGPDVRRPVTRCRSRSTAATTAWRDLLKSAGDVTGILSERSQQVNTLILNANDLLGVLNDRRQAIVGLLANTSAVSRQLTGLVADNEKELAPALEKLNAVTRCWRRTATTSARHCPGCVKYQLTQGETVANGVLLQRVRPQHPTRAAPAAVPGLCVRVPARCERRAAAGQCRSTRRTPIPRQRDPAARRPSR